MDTIAPLKYHPYKEMTYLMLRLALYGNVPAAEFSIKDRSQGQDDGCRTGLGKWPYEIL